MSSGRKPSVCPEEISDTRIRGSMGQQPMDHSTSSRASMSVKQVDEITYSNIQRQGWGAAGQAGPDGAPLLLPLLLLPMYAVKRYDLLVFLSFTLSILLFAIYWHLL